MAGYDRTALKAAMLFFVRDPNGRSVAHLTDTQIRDFYINPAYRDWYNRFERRPMRAFGALMPVAGDKTTGSNLFANDLVEHVTLTAGGVEGGLQRDEFNRLRQLQETEGAIGQIRMVGFSRQLSGTTQQVLYAWYPIPDAVYTINAYGTTYNNSLALAGTLPTLDPVSARYVARLAAYRLGCDLRLSRERLLAIVAPLPSWVRSHFKMQWLFEDKPFGQESSFGHREETEVTRA